MRISSELSDAEIKTLLQSFYEYFENGYVFEEFLREYLVRMGLVRPIFSKNEMDKFIKHNAEAIEMPEQRNSSTEETGFVEKMITANDIRARIISIPSFIMKQIDEDVNSIDVLVNNVDMFHFNIIRGRNYFGGVTEFHKKYELITDDGVANPKNTKWRYDYENKVVKIYID